MNDAQDRSDHYRKLCERLGANDAHRLIDRLQVLALTRPDTVRELEVFLHRRDEAPRERAHSDK